MRSLLLAVLVGGMMVGCDHSVQIGAYGGRSGVVHTNVVLRGGDRLNVFAVGSVEATVITGIGVKDMDPANVSGALLNPSAVQGTVARDGARVTTLESNVVVTYDVPKGPATIHVRVTALKLPLTRPPVLDTAVVTDHIYVVPAPDVAPVESGTK